MQKNPSLPFDAAVPSKSHITVVYMSMAAVMKVAASSPPLNKRKPNKDVKRGIISAV
jgi:hypothetical protein